MDLPDPNRLIVGQSLVIPKPGTSHIVKYGDTLWSISQQYGVTIQAIVQANQLTDPNVLYPGTKLFIPPITHIVSSGETLAQIARRYRTTVQNIIEENQIANPNLIYPGTRLVIPRAKPAIEVNAYTYQTNNAAIATLNEIGHLLYLF